ncbi:hydrolase [Lonsdalea britannica]|uniref:Hydrolase n=1 Tax=Lonsdalea britannica TaxID=1082704 RepID=A0AAD0WLS8_9GAMM|nr:hydrolase [Lonsdalea britannica]AXW88130.1 hydrolase [Lonsdalea britannica]OSN00206.1 hydrolase [Lonsdalea britannica]OSN03505.1 hydrolase [Lonsdalea britannica]
MLILTPSTTALVLIDLQEGILPFAGGPYAAEDVVHRADKLATLCRQRGATVILVRVGWSADFGDAPRQTVDHPNTGGPLPDNWLTFASGLHVIDSDIRIIKHQWGAFYGTDLDLQLRRRGIDTLILGGISTNIGVESTARSAWEHGYNLVIAEDLCSAGSAEQHQSSMTHIFPRIARVRNSADIKQALTLDTE